METYQPKLAPKLVEKRVKETPHAELFSQGKREDGRSLKQVARRFFKTAVNADASGSAYVEVGKTKLVCSIHGPKQSRKLEFSDQGKLWCDFKYAPFAKSSRATKMTSDERHTSLLLVDALEASIDLEKFPKSVIEAHVLVLEAGEDVVGTAITCVSLALADAGIELFDFVSTCSMTCHKIGNETHLVLDPSCEEAEHHTAVGSVSLAYMPSLRQTTHIVQTGALSEDLLNEMIHLCTDGCSLVYQSMRSVMLATIPDSK